MTRSQGGFHQLPAQVGWAAVGVLAIFVTAGVVPGFGDRPVVVALAGAVALSAGGAALFSQNRLLVLPAAAVSTAAIAVLGDGNSSNMGWFGICILAGWCALTASVWTIGTFWAAVTVLFVLERLVSAPDPGWFAWIAGTSTA
jgi:hypothetical protein